MALTEEGSGMVMPVSPMGGNGFGNGFGGDGWWIILLLLFAGGWGNGFGGGFGGGELYPWMNQADITSSGFQNLATQNQITGIQSSIGDIQTALCNGFAGVNATVNGGFANAEVANNARQMANMQQMFGLSEQFANCCCENRLASADLKYTIATENCADRAALSDGVRDILANQNASVQRILDQMCNDKIDQKNERIADLERQLTMANLAASQTAQTAQLIADNTAQTQYVVNRIAPYPTPAYIVANPNTYSGCGNF